MTEFELLVIPLSLILGLGMTTLLSGLIHALRARLVAPLHWLPLAWAFSIVLFTLAYFNVLYDMSQSDTSWTWSVYGPVLTQTLLLFLSSGLILSHDATANPDGMLNDFEAHGRLALVPFGILLALAPVTNLLVGTPWLHPANLSNVVLTMIIVATLVSKRRAVRSAMTVVFTAVMVLSVLTVWSQPGN